MIHPEKFNPPLVGPQSQEVSFRMEFDRIYGILVVSLCIETVPSLQVQKGQIDASDASDTFLRNVENVRLKTVDERRAFEALCRTDSSNLFCLVPQFLILSDAILDELVMFGLSQKPRLFSLYHGKTLQRPQLKRWVAILGHTRKH